jgi:hypothetical protein
MKQVSGSKSSKQNGKGIVDKFIENLPVELHLLGTIHKEPFQVNDESLKTAVEGKTRRMEFCGPGTRYDSRFAKGERGINQLDNACMYHDAAYKNKNPIARNQADSVLASKALQYLQKPGISTLDKIDGNIVTAAMKLIKRKP